MTTRSMLALLLSAVLAPAASAQTYAPLVTMTVTTPDAQTHELQARESNVASLTLKDGTVYELRPTIHDEPFTKVTIAIFKAATAASSTTLIGEVQVSKGRPPVETKTTPRFKIAVPKIDSAAVVSSS